MKKLRASLAILSVTALQGCCCGMSGFPGGRDNSNYFFTKLFNSSSAASSPASASEIYYPAAKNKHVCRLVVAVNGEWETSPRLIGWKTEAKRRGFTTETCTQIMLSDHTDKRICMFSIRNDEWTTEDLLFVNEAKRRGLSPAKCKSL